MSRIGVVTGATQGLGFALAEGLARQLAPADIVYLTGRDADRVVAAVERLTVLPQGSARTDARLPRSDARRHGRPARP